MCSQVLELSPVLVLLPSPLPQGTTQVEDHPHLLQPEEQGPVTTTTTISEFCFTLTPMAYFKYSAGHLCSIHHSTFHGPALDSQTEFWEAKSREGRRKEVKAVRLSFWSTCPGLSYPLDMSHPSSVMRSESREGSTFWLFNRTHLCLFHIPSLPATF